MTARNSFTEIIRIANSVSRRAAAALVVLGLLVAASVVPAAAQLDTQPRFRIPFAFMASGKMLPPGEYRLSRVEPKVLSLQRTDGSAGVVFSTVSDYPTEADIVSRSELVFDSYFGREYALSFVRASGDVQFNVRPGQRGEQVARNGSRVREVTILAERR